ncbi:MAG: pantoate--beta-alanine ligase [Pseudomonadota bacterium]
MMEWTTVAQMRAAVAGWKAAGEQVALVPTMGALHAGHLALVEAARAQAQRVVVSIFVNPTQFGPNEDFDRYPRPLARDLALLRAAGADGAWLPTVAEMYPHGFATSIRVGGVSAGLDGDARPGHFDGVATVVSKLLLQVAPAVALFGQKDYQQLCVIKRVVADLDIPVRILGVPTVREADGLALSSRNQYLTAAERAIAPALQAALVRVAAALVGGAAVAPVLAAAVEQLLAAGFAKVDYLELRAEDTLAPLAAYQPPARLLVAAWLGTTRLIDNLTVE